MKRSEMIGRLNKLQETLLWYLAVPYAAILLTFLLTDTETLFSRTVAVTLVFGALGAVAIYSLRTETHYVRRWRQIVRPLNVLGRYAVAAAALALLLGVVIGGSTVILELTQAKQIQHLRSEIRALESIAKFYKAAQQSYRGEITKRFPSELSQIDEVVENTLPPVTVAKGLRHRLFELGLLTLPDDEQDLMSYEEFMEAKEYPPEK